MSASSTGDMKNLKSKKLYLQVYDELCNYIRANNLQPGDKLPTEMEMTARLGVSRNVLREAIKALEISGVVSSKPGVGITIRRPGSDFYLSTLVAQMNRNSSEDQIRREVEQMRHVLEIGFAEVAYRSITDTEIEAMREQLAIMESRGVQSKDPCALGVDFAAADARFHALLFSRVDNSMLFSTLDLFWVFDRYYQVQLPRESYELIVDKHRRIYNALKDRNLTAFLAAMDYHFGVFYEKE